MVKRNLVDTYRRRLGGELPTITFAIGIVVGCFVGYTIYSRRYKDTANSVGSSIVNAIVIIILSMVYRAIAVTLANWENHRYQDSWEDSLVTKNFAF